MLCHPVNGTDVVCGGSSENPASFQDLRRALLSTLGSSTGVGSVAINGSGANNSARSRAVAEAALVWRVMLRLREELGRVGMWNSFQGENSVVGRGKLNWRSTAKREVIMRIGDRQVNIHIRFIELA